MQLLITTTFINSVVMEEQEKKAGMAYIVLFLQDVRQLNNDFAALSNVLIGCRGEVNCQHFDELWPGKGPGSKLSLRSQLELRNALRDFRLRATVCYVQYLALKPQFLNAKIDNTIESLKPKIYGDHSLFAPNYSDIEKYVNSFNQFFSSEVVRKALIVAQESYAQFAMEQKTV